MLLPFPCRFMGSARRRQGKTDLCLHNDRHHRAGVCASRRRLVGNIYSSARKTFRFRVASAADRQSATVCSVCSANKKSPKAIWSLGVENYTFCLHLKKLIAKTACIKSASKSAKSSVITYECAHFCILLSNRCIFMHLLLHDKGDKSRGKTLFCEVFTQHFGYLG